MQQLTQQSKDKGSNPKTLVLQHWRAAHDRELLLAATRHGWGFWGQLVQGLPEAVLAAMQREITPSPSPQPPAGIPGLAGRS